MNSKVFDDRISKQVEVYIDDIMVKTTFISNHIDDWQDDFDYSDRFNV